MNPTASHDTATPHALEQTMTFQAEDVVSELAAGSSQSGTATPTALSENSGEDEPRAAPDEQRGFGGLVLLGAALVISILLVVYLIVNNLSHKNIEE
jgi:hypothetical protein